MASPLIDDFLRERDGVGGNATAVSPQPSGISSFLQERDTAAAPAPYQQEESSISSFLQERQNVQPVAQEQPGGSAIDSFLQERQTSPSVASQQFKEQLNQKAGGLAPQEQPQPQQAPQQAQPEQPEPYQPTKQDESSFFQNLATKWKSGSRKWAIDQAAYDVAMSPNYTGLQKSLQELRKFNKEQASSPEGRNWFEKAAFGAAESLPGMVKSNIKGIPAALAGGGAALALGQAGPQIGLPEELVTVPLGLKWGLTAGSAHQWYKQGTGEMFLNMVDEGVAPDTAKRVAPTAGVMYAASEYLFSIIRGLPAVFKNNPVVSASIRKTAASLARQYAKGVISESSEEFLQQAIQEFASNIAKDMQTAKGGAVLKKLPIADILQRAASAFVQSIGPSAILIAPGAVVQGGGDVRTANAMKSAGIPEGYQLVEGKDGYEILNAEGKVEATGKRPADVIKKVQAQMSGGMPIAPIASPENMTGRIYEPLERTQAQSKIEVIKAEMKATGKWTDEQIDNIELSERWDREVEFAELLEKITGKQVIITRNNPVNGLTTEGRDTIFVDERSEQPMLAAIGHEMNHAFDGESFETTGNITEAADQIMRNAIDPALLEARATESNTTVDQAWAEAKGDIIGQAMTTREFWQNVERQSPSLLQRMYQQIAKVIGKFGKVFDNRYKGEGIGQDTVGLFQSKDQMDAAFKAASDVFYQWTQSAQAKQQGFTIGQTKALATIAKQNRSAEPIAGVEVPTGQQVGVMPKTPKALPAKRLFGEQAPDAGNREAAFANIERAVNETTDRKELVAMARAVGIKVPTSTKALKANLVKAWQRQWEQEATPVEPAVETAKPISEAKPPARVETEEIIIEKPAPKEELAPPPTTPLQKATEVARPVETPVVGEGVEFSVGSSVRLGTNPQPFTITEVLKQSATEKKLGEQFYVIKNNKAGEEITSERQDLKAIKLKPEAQKAVTSTTALNKRLRELGMDAKSFKNKKQKQAAIKRAEAKSKVKTTSFEQTREYAKTDVEKGNLDAGEEMAKKGEIELSERKRKGVGYVPAYAGTAQPVRQVQAKWRAFEAKNRKVMTDDEVERRSERRILKAGDTEIARHRIAQIAKERNLKELPKAEAQAIMREHGMENVLKEFVGGKIPIDETTGAIAHKIFSTAETTRRATSDDENSRAVLMVAIANYGALKTKLARTFRGFRDRLQGPALRRQALNEMVSAISDGAMANWDKLSNEQKMELAQKEAKLATQHIAIMKKLGVDLSAITDEQLMDDELFSSWLRVIQSQRASKADKVYEYWRNSILSGPLTQIVNIVGNAAMMNWEFFVQRPAEALFNTVLKKKDGPTLESLSTMYKQILPSLVHANMNLVKAWSTEQAMTRGLKIEEKGVALGGKLGRGVRAPQRGMLAMDEWFKTIIQTATRADYAVREANKQGLTGTERDEFIRYSMENAGSEANMLAIEESLRLSWQNEPMQLGKIILGGRRTKGITGWIFKYMFPFVTTPSNIISTGLRKSPLGLLNMGFKSLITGEYKQAGGEHMLLRDATEQVLAGAVLWSLYGLTAGDADDPPRLTGSVSGLPSKRRFQYANMPPQSLRIGDRWFSYSRVEPVATILTTTVDLLNAWRQAKGGNTQGVADDLWQSIKSNVRDKTFLQSVGDIIRAVEDENRAIGLVQNFASSWMPNIVRQSLRATDPLIRDYRTQQKGWEKTKEVLNQTGSMTLPVAGLQPPPRRDHWGKPASKDTDMAALGTPTSDLLWRLIVPVRAQKASTMNNIDRMIWNWNRAQKDRVNIWWPTNPRNSYKLYPNRDAQPMIPEVYSRFQKMRGDRAWQLLKNRQFNFSRPSEREMDIVRKMFSKATSDAKNKIVNELRQEERRKKPR